MEKQYLKIQNYNKFSPKQLQRPPSFNLKERKLINYNPKTSKFSNSTMAGYSSSKNIFSYRKNFITSSSNINIFTPKTQTPKIKKISRIKPQSASSKKRFPFIVNNLNRSMLSNNCLETEQLYHETYQIKKVIKQLQKQLEKVSKENNKKERQLSAKEKEINNIIYNNFQITNEDNKNNSYYNNEILKFNKPNNPMGILIFKIRRELKDTINEIKKEDIKLEYLKRSLYMTKPKELNIESIIYKEQINKINSLIENALIIKEQNDNKENELNTLKENLDRQEIIISNLKKENINLESESDFLNTKLEKLKNEVKLKIKKAKKNNSELNILSLRSKNLLEDKIQKQPLTTKKDGIPITLKSLYTSKVSELKKSINLYKRNIKYTEDILNKLKDQKKKLVDANKNFDQKIKIDSNFIDTTSKIKSYQRPQSSLGGYKSGSKEEDLIMKLREEYKKSREDELNMQKKVNIYYNKLREISIEMEEKEKKEEEKKENQLEFGIDETNPYYTENEENIPESNIKFTSQQFNQFTYILFKNFEAKFIVGQESNNKIINPFNEFIKQNNFSKLTYPSNEFDTVVDHFSKIIMTVLNSDNEYNYTLTKIFIGALLYNSECDINKLIEYFSILFSYTKDYSSDEKKLIEKLKTKYKKETKKLVECISSYILNDMTSSQYFSLFKMKELLDNNEINLKDKYVEFLFYYMKKFSAPDAKLEDLKFSLLNDIVPLGDTTVHSKAFNENKEELNDNIDLDNIENIKNDNDLNILNDIDKLNKNENNNIDIEDKLGIINIEENKEIDFDIDKSNEEYNNKTEKSKSDKNKEEIFFEKNKKKNKNNQENSSVNKAKRESKKDETNPMDNITDKSKEKEKNADLFDDDNDIINNSKNNDSRINNEAKINDNEDNKEINDSNIIEDNNKDIDIIKIKEEDIKKLENKNEDNEKVNNDNNINDISEKEIHRVSTPNNIIQINYEKEKEKNNNQEIKIESNEDNTLTQKLKENEEQKNIINVNINDNNEDTKKGEFKTNDAIVTNENEDESVTEITNEDFIKYIKESLNSIQRGLDDNNLELNSYIEEHIKKIEINGENYDYINIEDLNDKLIEIKVILNDLQLSCLCSKFSVPNELRFINIKTFGQSLQDIKNGNLKLEPQ